MGTQRAGDEGKPSIHIGSNDADIAKELDVEDDSPSSVYSEALENWQEYEKKRQQKRKDLRKKAQNLKQEARDWGFELVGDIV